MSVRVPMGAFAVACALFLVVAVASSEGASAKPVNTSLPVISGTPQQGLTLTATSGTWTSRTTVTYAYQWRRCNASGSLCSSISGATATTYKLVAADVGGTIRIQVTARNTAGSTTATSTATAVVSAPPTPPANTSPPTISGTAQEGRSLTAAPGTWSGSQPITFGYRWQRCDAITAVCADILGATGTSYTAGSADVGAKLRVAVTATNSAGSAEASSSATATVVAAAPVNSAPPTIAGTPRDGQTLTADPGAWSSSTTPTYAYQWRRCDANGGSCADIALATGQTYTLGSADVGATIRVAVTATNSGGSASATSAATAVVDPLPGPPANTSPPAISGTPQQGQTLTASDGTWSGTQPISFSYQWRACDSAGTACQDRSAGTAKTYALTAGDVGATMRVTVTASNADGNAMATSAQTAVVTAAPAPSTEVVVTAAGDIASSTTDSAGTASLVEQIAPDRALTLGDNAYNDGTLAQYNSNYAPNWGRFLGNTSPTPGNHEYHTAGAPGYFQYFGAQAPGPYYAFDLGAWHLISLDSEIPLGSGSAQLQWLQDDLNAHAGQCILAYWHRPRFSSGTQHGSASDIDPFWRALSAAGADVVVNGHEHQYERFAPQNPDGVADVNGMREFVVGTGGAALYPLGPPIANSEVRENASHGVLKLTLRTGGYDWRFVPVAGDTFSDSGTDSCSRSGDTTPPTTPANLAATASGAGIKLTWSAATDATGIAGYDVFRNGALLDRTSGTTYTDTAVTPGTTYDYAVRARDTVGNVSPLSATATATAATVVTKTLLAEADARVTESAPSTNYGTSYLRVDGGSGVHVESVLRFTVPPETASVGRATLRVYAYSDTLDGPAVFGAANTWTEGALTWANRPARTTGVLADLGSIPLNSWAEWDVSQYVSGPGTYSFLLTGESTDGVDLYSRETTNLQPQLVVTAG